MPLLAMTRAVGGVSGKNCARVPPLSDARSRSCRSASRQPISRLILSAAVVCDSARCSATHAGDRHLRFHRVPAGGPGALTRRCGGGASHLTALLAQLVRRPTGERCRTDPAPAVGTVPPRPARSKTGYRSVNAIAARWGLLNTAGFSRAFRAAYGLPPGAYRSEHSGTS